MDITPSFTPRVNVKFTPSHQTSLSPSLTCSGAGDGSSSRSSLTASVFPAVAVAVAVAVDSVRPRTTFFGTFAAFFCGFGFFCGRGWRYFHS